VNEWLSARADALAARSGLERAALELSDEEIDAILDLAGHAAHESGVRTNAPLLCYLIGRAQAGGASFRELDEIARSTS
jgi:hypothetical protein